MENANNTCYLLLGTPSTGAHQILEAGSGQHRKGPTLQSSFPFLCRFPLSLRPFLPFSDANRPPPRNSARVGALPCGAWGD